MIKLSRVTKLSLTSIEEVVEKTFGFLKIVKKSAWHVESKGIRIKKHAYLKKIWAQ